MIVLAHTAAHITDLGISTTVAATVLSAIGGFSILGRLGMGAISDVLGSKLVLIISIILMATSLLWLQFAREMWMFYLFAAGYGIAHGALYTVYIPMLAELFGLGSLGSIVGIFIFVGRIGGAISPTLAGRIFDITGSYQTAFLLCLVLSVTAAILMFFVKPIGGSKL